MSLYTRTFRVFVSSTFADLVEERNALQRIVWPVLAKLCEKAGFRFQAIDLRWGVPSEAALDQRTSRICLDELKRCQETSPRPNFIILLGNRYGWRPLPEEIEAKEFEAIAAKAQSLELDDSLLREWYRLDTNAVPAVHYLRPRRQDADEANGTWWTDNVEQPLRSLILQCIDALWTQDDPRRIDYERSLTEREIMTGALNPTESDARDHVFAYFRGVDYLDSVTHVEEAEAKHMRSFVDFETTTECDTTARGLHQNLKKNLEATLGDEHVRKFEATWTGTTISQDHLDQLCDAVLNDLRGVIEAEIRKFEEKPPLEVEISANDEFAKLRGGSDDSGQSRFQGRAENLNVISEYVRSTEMNRPLVIFGPAGSGKSALMAKAALDASKNFPNAVQLKRFIGVTPQSVDARSLLLGLCEELGQKFQNTAEVPIEYRELVSTFRERLGWATIERPLIVFLDAIDQLSETDNARSLRWLPQQLPPHVRLVISVLDDPLSGGEGTGTKSPTNIEPIEILKRRDREGGLLHQIGDYPEHDARALLSHLMCIDKRTLTADQETLLLEAFAKCPRPLFLRLATEEAKQWRSDSTTMKMPGAAMPDEMLPAIINQLFDRLSEPSNHGEHLVERAIGYLVASKNGLTEDELLGLLSSDKDFFNEFVSRAKQVKQPLPPGVDALPMSVWVRLYSDLQTYLTTRRADETTLLAFYHRSLEHAARRRFLAKPEIAEQRHNHIANYFTPAEPHGFFRLTPAEQGTWGTEYPLRPRPVIVRNVVELPWQLRSLKNWNATSTLLTDWRFLEAKVEAGLVSELMTEIQSVLLRLPVEHGAHRRLTILLEALRRDVSFLANRPACLFQQLWNLSLPHDASEATRHEDKQNFKVFVEKWRQEKETEQEGFVWLRSLQALPVPLGSQMNAVFRTGEKAVTGVAWSPNGRSILSASVDGSLQIWDFDSGLMESCMQASPGMSIRVAWSPDAATFIWGIRHGPGSQSPTTLGVRSAETGEELWSVQCLPVCDFSWFPDGRTIAVATRHNGIKLLDAFTGQELPFRCEDNISAIACSPSEEIFACWTDPNYLQFLSKSTVVKQFRPVIDEILDRDSLMIAWSPDGRSLAISGSRDVLVFEAATGKRLYRLKGHTDTVKCVAWSPDGKYLASGSGYFDRTVCIWEVAGKSEGCRLRAHVDAVTSIAWSNDSRFLVSGSNDGTMRIWNIAVSMEQSWHHDRKLGCIRRSATWSNDGRYVATRQEFEDVRLKDELLQIWDTLSPRLLFSLRGHDRTVQSIAWSQTSGVLASGSTDNTVRLWDAATGQQLFCCRGHHNTVECLAWSPISNMVASGSFDQTIRIWDGTTGAELCCLSGHEGSVDCVEWSPNGQILASGSSDNTVRLWNPETGTLMRCLGGIEHRSKTTPYSTHGHIYRVAWLGGGSKRLACFSSEQAIRIWDVTTGECELVHCSAHFTEHLGRQFSELVSRYAPEQDATLSIVDSGREISVKSGNHRTIACVNETLSYVGASMEARRVGGLVGHELIVFAIEGSLGESAQTYTRCPNPV